MLKIQVVLLPWFKYDFRNNNISKKASIIILFCFFYVQLLVSTTVSREEDSGTGEVCALRLTCYKAETAMEEECYCGVCSTLWQTISLIHALFTHKKWCTAFKYPSPFLSTILYQNATKALILPRWISRHPWQKIPLAKLQDLTE